METFWTPDVVEIVAGAISVLLVALAGVVFRNEHRRIKSGIPAEGDKVTVDMGPVREWLAQVREYAQGVERQNDQRFQSIERVLVSRLEEHHTRLVGHDDRARVADNEQAEYRTRATKQMREINDRLYRIERKLNGRS